MDNVGQYLLHRVLLEAANRCGLHFGHASGGQGKISKVIVELEQELTPACCFKLQVAEQLSNSSLASRLKAKYGGHVCPVCTEILDFRAYVKTAFKNDELAALVITWTAFDRENPKFGNFINAVAKEWGIENEKGD